MKHFWNRRRLMLWAGILVLGGGVWLGIYAWDHGFTRKWRSLIAKELAKHGLRAEIGRLTLDPVEGLTARDVKLFDMMQRDQLLATIDGISLDIDVARLVNQEDFLRTLHLQKADVALPVDPGDPRSEWLTVQNLNARLVFQQDRIEIAQAEGVVSGILVKASGKVRKPETAATTAEEKARQKQERSRQLREMRDRRGALRSVLRILDRFRIPQSGGVPERPHKAELTLELEGDLADIDRMEVRAALSGGALIHRGGVIEGFEAGARLSEGVVTLQRLAVRDRFGAMHAAATWEVRGPPVVTATADCSLDLQSLLRSVLDEAPWLGEVVCYTPPELAWDGKWNLKPEPGDWPVEGQGHVTAGRFSTRGVVFDGLEAKVALSPGGGIYVRDGLLNHHTGEVRGQAMLGKEGGRYELDWRMALIPALPFVPPGGLRRAMERFAFEADSRIFVRMKGGRTEGRDYWKHAGGFQLRNFSYQGTRLPEAAGEITVNPEAEIPLIFRNALLEMEEGTGKAKEVGVDTNRWLLHLTGAEGALMPAPLLHLFLPPLGRALEKYRFEQAPEAKLEGVIDLKGLDRSDYRIALRPRGRCVLDVAGRPLTFDQVSGSVHILGPDLRLSLTGNAMAGTEAFQVLRLVDAAPATFAGRFPLSAKTGGEASWEVEVRAPGRVKLDLLGRQWPLDQLAGQVKSRGTQVTVTGGGRIFEGKLGASLEFPDTSVPGHHGSVVVENASFAKLAAFLDPARKSEGRVTGNFNYQINGNEHGFLSGQGNALLEEANIFALPLLGPLSTLVNALLPGENVLYSVARKATASYTVKDSMVTVPDFEAATTAFKLKASGETDYTESSVNFLARVNLRGAPGMILYPVSKLFEFVAEGTVAEPGWRPRFFPSPFRSRPAAALDADEQENPDSRKPPEAPVGPRQGGRSQ